jgi:hypothetical protein
MTTDTTIDTNPAAGWARDLSRLERQIGRWCAEGRSTQAGQLPLDTIAVLRDLLDVLVPVLDGTAIIPAELLDELDVLVVRLRSAVDDALEDQP